MDAVVVGSLNLDTTLRVSRLPAPGETVLGTGRFTDTGGKGANQAMALARLGRRVAMVGMVGDDEAGRTLLRALSGSGVEVSGVAVSSHRPTGMAVITVDDSGENAIVVDPGANGSLGPEQVATCAEALAEAAVTLIQLEVPMAAVSAAVSAAGGRVLLNPAPAAPIPDEVLAAVSVLIPNATELARLTGEPEPPDPESAARLAAQVDGPEAVVVTLGRQGAVVVEPGRWKHLPAPPVEAVDPTGAGDAFCGGLADALIGGASLEEAVAWAVRCGAAAASRWGAQASLPTRAEVEEVEEA